MKSNKSNNKTNISNTKILEKTKNLLGARIVFYIIVLIGAILIFIAPLLHIYISKENPSIVAYKKELKIKENRYSEKLVTLRKKYDNGILTAENFIIQNDSLKKILSSQKETNRKLLNIKINNNRVFGWKTLRVFLVGFGIRLPYLLFSFIISYLIFIINTDNKFLKKSFMYLQITAYTTSFYNLTWCFWYSQDYPLETYRYAIVFVSALVATSVVYFITYKNAFTTRLQKIVNVFSTLAIIIAPEYMNIEQKQKFKRRYINELEKGAK